VQIQHTHFYRFGATCRHSTPAGLEGRRFSRGPGVGGVRSALAGCLEPDYTNKWMANFERLLKKRSAATYEQFLLRWLKPGGTLLDCGCGNGAITVGLAAATNARGVIGPDRERNGFHSARDYARAHRISALRFVAGDLFSLPFRDYSFDAAPAHSVLEAVRNPLEVLREIRRVLKRGGLIGAASVHYGGLLIWPDPSGLLSGFYKLRKRWWQAAVVGWPYRGRQLRAILQETGYRQITTSARYSSYGSPNEVRSFGMERARECASGDFGNAVLELGLADEATLGAMEDAWEKWSTAQGSFLAFGWCDAAAWK